MAARDKIDELYDALMLDGAVTKSRDNFRDYVNDENNRRKLYDALKADGAVTSNTFDEFSNKLGFNAPAERSYSPQGVSTMDDVPQNIAGVKGKGATEAQMQETRTLEQQAKAGEYQAPKAGEAHKVYHTDPNNPDDILRADTITRTKRGNAAIVEVEKPTVQGEKVVQDKAKDDYRWSKEIYMEGDGGYTPDATGMIRFGWRKGQRVGNLSSAGLQLADRGHRDSDAYTEAAAKAESMSDAQLQAEFNRLSEGVKDLRAFVDGDPAGARELGSVLQAYARELRARDLNMGHGKDMAGRSGEYNYQAARLDPVVATEMDRLQAMNNGERTAALRQAYHDLATLRMQSNADPGRVRAVEARLLAGAMIHGRSSAGQLPEDAYNDMVRSVLGLGTVEGTDAEIHRLEQLIAARVAEVDDPNDPSFFQTLVAAESGPAYSQLWARRGEDPQLRMYYAALAAAKQRKKILEMHENQWGFWHTLGSELIDPGTWDMNITNFMNTMAAATFGKGKYGDEALAGAASSMVDNMARLAEDQKTYKPTDMQSYASMTAQMLPFMLQFAITGGYSGIAKAGGKLAARAAAKIGAGETAAWVMRNLGVVAGDFVAGWAMANTVGAAKTWDDIVNKHQGYAVRNPDGSYSFVDGMSWGEAFYKGQMANTIENFTELLGGSVFDKALGKWVWPRTARWAENAADWLGSGKLLQAFERMSESQAMDVTRRLMSRGGIQDYPSEVLEEWSGMFLNPLFGTGENEFSDLFDKDKQREIVVGLFLSMGFLQAPGRVGAAWDTAQYYRYQHKLDNADALADYNFSANADWVGLKERIDGTSNEQMPEMLSSIIDDKALSNTEKKYAVDYLKNLMIFRGYNLRTNTKARDAASRFDENGNHIAPDMSGAEGNQAYAQGYNADEADRIEVKDLYDLRRSEVEEFVSDEMLAQFDSDPMGALAAINNNEQWTDEEKAKAVAYINAKARYDGMMARVEDDIDHQVQVAGTAIDSHVWRDGDAENPVVIKGVMKNGDRQVYVVSGDVVMSDDGSMVDPAKSSSSIVIIDEATGKVEMVAPGDIASVDAPVSAAELHEQSASTIRSEMQSQADMQINGTLPFQVGDVYGIESDDGTTHKVEVVADNGNMLAVLVDGASEPVEMAKADVQAGADRARKTFEADVDAQSQNDVPPVASAAANTASQPGQTTDTQTQPGSVVPPAEYHQDDLVTVNLNGQVVTGQVAHDVDDDGNLQVYLDQPVEGSQVLEVTPDELNDVLVSYTSRDAAVQPAVASAAVGNSGVPPQDGSMAGVATPSSPLGSAATEPQQGEPPAAQSMPMKEVNGKQVPDFEQASAEQSHDYLYGESTPYAPVVADKIVDNTIAKREAQVAEAQKAYDAAQALEPAIDENASVDDIDAINEELANIETAKQEAAQALETAQRELEKWQVVKQRRAQAQAQQAAQVAAQVARPATGAVATPAAGVAVPGTTAGTPGATTPVAPAAPGTTEAATAPVAAPGVETPAEVEGQAEAPVQSTTPIIAEYEGQAPQPAEAPATNPAEEARARRIAEKQARIKARVRELADKCGIPSHVIESREDLANYPKYIRDAVEAQLKAGNMVHGFFDPRTGHMFYYMPGVDSLAAADRVYSHETVAHGGLRALLRDPNTGSTEAFDALCDKVYELMTVSQRIRYMNYVQSSQGNKRFVANGGAESQANKRIAADEYMAHLSEGREAVRSNRVRKIINAIMDAIRKYFKGRGINLNNIKTDADVMRLLAESRRNLTEMDKAAINQEIGDALDGKDDENTGHPLFSTTSIMEGAGLEVKQMNEAGELVPLSDKDGNVVARVGGKEFSVHNPVTAKDLESDKNSVLSMIIEDAKSSKLITDKKAKTIYKKYAEIVNMYLTVGSAELGGVDALEENWEWLGDTVYRTVAANGDAQYSYSMDIIKVCKKNEAVIKAISAFQREVRRGATPSDIVDLYRKAYAEGYQVPCPVCYVFTRYIRNGKYASAAIKGMRDYGEHLKGGNDVWTAKQWVEELDRLNRATNPDYKPDGKNKMEGEELEKAKRFAAALEKANKITLKYENRINALSFELTKGCSAEREAEIMKEIEIMDEQYQWAVDIIAHQSLTNWIKTFAIEEKDNKWRLREDTSKPADMEDFENNALDLRLTSNTMVNYPAIQRLRRSGGSAAGKEITFASNNELGEVISGLGISKSSLNDYPNFWMLASQETDPKLKRAFRKKAKARLEDAAVYAAMQTLRGGQRMWSWSDNIERLAPDIAINIMQLEILGGAMQTYSKQLEGIKLTAQMGAYVNGSLMAKDNGWREVSRDDVEERDGRLWLKKAITDVIDEPQAGGGTQKRERVIAGEGAYVYQAKDGKLYTLIYDDVVGVDPFGNYEVTYYDKDDVKREHPKKRKSKGLFDLNQEYDKAGNILVGMNDLHVLAAMADPNVYFIIPWHASGANNHILAQMLDILGQAEGIMDNAVDYTSMQEEKNMGERNKDTKRLPEIDERLRKLWDAARVEAEANGWTSGMDVDSNGTELTEDQYMYRQLRSLIFNGYIFEKAPTESEYRKALAEARELEEEIADLTAQQEGADDVTKKRLKNRADNQKRRLKKLLHIMELHDGLIDWRDSALHTSESAEDAAWRAEHPKRITLKEARAMIEKDHFLSQVMRRVEPIGHMTNGDNTFVYPYEYWDESSDYKTADINGRRYVEYCRRLGYRPKFSGDWKAGNFDTGNFVDAPGYWKLLIDRRMYDREGKYQWLDPVDSSAFDSSLVNPLETQQEFHVTTVADDAGAESIAQDVYKEQGERGTGKVASVDYEKSLDEVVDGFETAMEKGVQNSPLLWSVSPEGVMEVNEKNALEDGIRFSTSQQIASMYPNWMDNQVITDEDSKKGQQTQVAGTLGTYKKVGAWIEDNLGKDVAVLDASSGMGLGTQELRQNGFNIEDIEPYPSGVRMKNNPPTYSGVNAYAEAKEDGKKYDFIISNAVLNVIPDDWRSSVLHDMADLLDVGGKMFINTRKTSEVKGIKNKIELESPNEVLVGTPDKITSYQRFFTPKELKEYVEGELGDGYTVEVANMKNSGTSGLSAVVVTKTAEGPLFSLSPEYRKRSFEDMDSGKVPLNGNLNPEEGDGKFEVIDDENKIFKNWRGTIQRRHKDYNVGKPMDGVYFHKNYAEDIVPKNILDKAREIAEREGFDYNCMYYNPKKPDVVRFDEAPDFDTAREPITGYYLTVDTSTGEAKRSKNRSAQIWHNKWMWVKDDYKGFDVDEAYEWSKTWNKRVSNPDGLPDKWEYLLTKAGLPVDWSGSALESNSGVLFSFSPNKVDFDNTRNRAVAKRGIVMPGLNESEIVIVNVPRHDFTGTGKQAIQKARKWAEDWLYGEHTAHEGTSEEFRYNIDEDSVDKFLSASSTTNSENLGVHLAVLKELISIINESLDTEIHPDYKKVGKKRSAANGIDNPNLLIHRMYGAIEIDGEIRRVKITMEEYRDSENHAYDYRVTKIGLPISGSATTNALGKPIISGANLLHGVEKSYDPGKKLLDESAKTTENGGPLMSATPAQTRSENFKRWFGDWENDPENASKVVDENGEPLVMTHNTPNEFYTFNRERIGSGQGQAFLGYGFNFSRGGNSTYGKREVQVYLDARNPLESGGHKLKRADVESVLRSLDEGESDTIVAELAGAYVPYGSREYESALRKVSKDLVEGDDDLGIYGTVSVVGDKPNETIEAFKALGFDSSIERDSEGRIRNAVVFDPEQIKSATDNNGDFSRENPDIRFSTSYSLGVPYQGTKGRIAREIVDMLPSGRRFVDLFSGGGAVTHAALLSGKYGEYHMNDIDGVGQELFMQGVRGEWDDYARTSMTPEEFDEIKGTPESLPWSHNGLGRNLAKGGRPDYINRVKRLGQLKDQADKIDTSEVDYRDVEIMPGDVVYCDIPYEGTDTRGYGKGQKFDKKAFDEWAQSQDFPVYVSEYSMPEGWVEIGSVDVRAMNRSQKRTEKLWVQEKFAEQYRDEMANEAGGPLFSSSGWELFPEDKDAHFEAVAEAVKLLSSKYNLACNVIFGDTSNLSVEDYARNIGEKEYYDSLSDDKKREYAEAFEKSRKGSGEYSPISKNVIIFALNNESFYELEGTLFHENVHKWLDENLSKDELSRLADDIWSNAVSKGLFAGTRNYIQTEYEDKEDWPEELIAYRMEWGMMSGRLKSIWRLFSMADNGSELFERILNDIGYDRQREKEERRTRAEENSTQAGGTLRRNSDERQEENQGSDDSGRRKRGGTGRRGLEDGPLFSVSDGVDALAEDYGAAFERLLDSVFDSLPAELRRGIVEDAMRNRDNDFRGATSAWLAGLADDDTFARIPDDVWGTIRRLLVDTMQENFVDGVPSDNEARYLLWRGASTPEGVFALAEDAVMRDALGVQEVSDDDPSEMSQGADGLLFSMSLRDRATARDTYERMVSSGRNQWVEAMQDSMLGLKKLMQSIMGSQWTKIEDIPMNQNPYIAENLMSSVTAAQQQAYYTEFVKPMLEEIAKLCKGRRREREKARQQLVDYMMAKHGLERNMVLADRDAKESAASGGNYNQAYADNRKRDYAGLTALTGKSDVQAAEAAAQQMVDDYERDHDVTDLWAKVNAATAASLEKQYRSGILSYADYQNIAGMFKFYIPLRGWDETTSDEVYGYLTSKAGPFLGGSIMKRAEGRSSKADDPIATIAKLGDDSIRTGNRNLMKERFLNFVLNHPSDAVSVNELWLQWDDVRNEWVPVFADIDPADDAATVEQKVQAFEQQMKQLAQAEPNKYKHGRDTVGIPYRVVPGMEREHQVLVKRNGQTYVLTINGNPRAAQALNGLTNPDVPVQGWVGSVLRGSERVNRLLSALYTTLSPAFIVSNFLRDSVYSNSMVWVKENPHYALTFHLNFGKVNPAYLGYLLRKWENGTLDESKPMQKYFKQFMLHGGETGFAMVQDVEDYKKKVQKELKDIDSKNVGKKLWNVVASQYERAGRSIENCARFAAFVTSIQMGRNVERAAYDAKEISVNFNKKGAGAKTWKLQGQTLLGNVGAFVSGAGRSLFTFWNAGVQGMTNLGRGFKRNPIKASLAVLAPLYAAGFFAPILAAIMGAAGGGDGDDEDKNAYYNLPEYVRRSNLCIYLGGLSKYLPEKWRSAGEAWLTIPLPIEFRAVYGLGELTYGAVTGNEHYTNEELAMQIASQFSQLLPIDMLEGGGGLHAFTPTVLKPWFEAEKNVSWSGLPIYRSDKYPGDEFKPEHTKAFSSAPDWIVKLSQWSNELGGGNEVKKADWDIMDWNPGYWDYMLRGYLGGIYTTISDICRFGKMGKDLHNGEGGFEWRNVPLANRILKQGDERTEAKALRNHYRVLEKEYNETDYLLKGYENQVDSGMFDYAKKIDLLHNSKEYEHYLIFSEFKNIIDAYMTAAKQEGDPAVKKWLDNLEIEQMREMVKMINDSDEGKPVDAYGYAQGYLRAAYDSAPDNNIKKELGKSMAKTYGGTDGIGSSDKKYNQVYADLRDANDIDEDQKIQAAMRAAKEVHDDELAYTIDYVSEYILGYTRSGKETKKTKLTKDVREKLGPYADFVEGLKEEKQSREQGLGALGDGYDEDVMELLRDLRKELIDELGIR